MQRPTKVLPLGLLVQGRVVVVVGAGEVGARKALDLAELGALVRVVDPAISAALDGDRAGIERVERAFEPRDLDDAWLVFAATDDARTQAEVRASCDARRIFCVAVDDIANATAWGMARVERGAMLVALSTHGTAPALARLMRELLEELLPDEPTLEEIQRLRDRWRAEALPMGERFRALVRHLASR